MKKPKEPKEPKEKKPKKPKKPKKEKPPKKEKASKKDKAPKEKKEGGGKKKLLILIPLVVIIAAGAVIFFVFRGGGGDDEPKAPEPEPNNIPEELTVGEEITVPGLTTEEHGINAVRSSVVTYTYSGLSDTASAAESYAAQMKDSENGFRVVDDEFVLCDAPSYDEPEGRVLLAKTVPVPEEEEPSEDPQESGPADSQDDSQTDGEDGQDDSQADGQDDAQSAAPVISQPPDGDSQTEDQEETEPEGEVYLLEVRWSADSLEIVTSQVPGVITSPPISESEYATHPMGMYDAQAYLEGLEPAVLGLSGSSMDEYEVMPIDGSVNVNGVPCTRLNVYSSQNSSNSNEFMGCYLVSKDGLHLYRLDILTNTVELLTDIEP